MVREEFIENEERGAGLVPPLLSAPLPSSTPSPPPTGSEGASAAVKSAVKRKAALPSATPSPPPTYNGCFVKTPVELKSWVCVNMPQLLSEGERFNKAVYKEMHKTLRAACNNTVAIIPMYDGAEEAARQLIQEFSDVSEVHGHTVCRVRMLFDSVHVMIGDKNLYE
jgi:hypothetical protein